MKTIDEVTNYARDPHGATNTGKTPEQAWEKVREQSYQRGADQGVGMFDDWLCEHPGVDAREAVHELRTITHAMRGRKRKSDNFMSEALVRLSKRLVRAGTCACPRCMSTLPPWGLRDRVRR